MFEEVGKARRWGLRWEERQKRVRGTEPRGWTPRKGGDAEEWTAEARRKQAESSRSKVVSMAGRRPVLASEVVIAFSSVKFVKLEVNSLRPGLQVSKKVYGQLSFFIELLSRLITNLYFLILLFLNLLCCF